MKQYVFTGAVVLAMFAAPAMAQTTPGGTSQTRSTNSAKTANVGADQKFIHEAAIGGMAEVELGKLAQQNASNPDVKSFGQRMVDDHGKANDELKALAQSKNVALPTELDAKHKALRDRLAKLQGVQFDRAYMQEMVQDHKKDVNEFRRESTSAKDADVRLFATKTLSTLEEHLKLAESTDKAVGTSGTKGGSKTKGE